MNHTLRRSTAAICQETDSPWDEALPIALLRIRVPPRSRLTFSAFEMLYSRPLPVSPRAGESIQALKALAVANYARTLGTLCP